MDLAATLAQASKAHLTVLHVTGRRGPGPAYLFAPPRAMGMSRRQKERLDSWMREAEALAPGRVSSTVLSGSAPDQILGFAKECGVDLIVVGVRGRRRVSRLLKDSLAERLLQRASCPVLFVPPNSAGAALSGV
jgi:nucleotide-binding universal stress UspA family protein